MLVQSQEKIESDKENNVHSLEANKTTSHKILSLVQVSYSAD